MYIYPTAAPPDPGTLPLVIASRSLLAGVGELEKLPELSPERFVKDGLGQPPRNLQKVDHQGRAGKVARMQTRKLV